MKKVFLITISFMFVVVGCGTHRSSSRSPFSPKPPGTSPHENSVQSGNMQILDNTKRLALVIGNSKYKNHSLKTPINDARDMKETLEKLNFKVLKYENLNQAEMKQKIDAFGEKMKNYDVALFYYAGHAVQTEGLNYLVPIDATLKMERQVEYQCVRADRMFSAIEGEKIHIVILDACRNNPFERSWGRNTNGSGLAFMQAPSNSFIAYATSPGQTASNGIGKNGFYTEILIQEMLKSNRTITQVFQEVRRKVGSKSLKELGKEQTTWESTSLYSDFYFIPPETDIPPLPEETTPPPPQNPNYPEMVFISGGTFQMGSNDGDSDEQPVHSVTVSDFYIGKYEVTHKEYIYFLNDINCSSSGSYNGEELIDMDSYACAVGYSGGKFYFKGSSYAEDILCPVIEVTWYGANEYCKWLSGKTGKTYRLPTEAEWEYATGGGSTHQKWAGTDYESSLSSYAWYSSNSGSKTHKVGTKSPNKFGLYDMSGNVWEWCNDWYESYSSSSQTDPKGPSSGSDRVFRGGSWYDNASRCRVAFRYHNYPTFSSHDIGFRVAARF